MKSVNMKGIWQYDSLNKSIGEKFQKTLNEGNTPLENIRVSDTIVFLKREDKNPNGSFKDRSIAYQMAYHMENGANHFAISSSGNAAISALAYAAVHEVPIDIFIGNNIPDHKYNKLNNLYLQYKSKLKVVIHQGERAKSDAIKFANNHSAINLRGSLDDSALCGFRTLAYEIIDQNPSTDAIFVCCSSGTSTVGIYEGLRELFEQKKLQKIPQIHIVQSTRIHPIAKDYDKRYSETQSSLADAITDRVAHRKIQVEKVLKESSGSGWIVSDEEIIHAKEILNVNSIRFEGHNSAVAFAGYLKAKGNGRNFSFPCCIMSGS